MRLGPNKLASAYTPGLTVSSDVVVRRIRRLPIKGEVLVTVGDAVTPNKVVARAMLPGPLQTIKLAEKFGIEPKDVAAIIKLKVGSEVVKGEIVAESKGLFGMFKQTITSDHTGMVESISEVTGNVLVREPSIPVDRTAYIQGRIAEVMPGEGVIVETRGAMIQGIFGIGGERMGTIRVAASGPGQPLLPTDIQESDRGKIVVGGSGLSFETIMRASQFGLVGLVAGGVRDEDLTKFLGYDIGVAITGQEAIDLTLVVTEGFGFLSMAGRTFDLFQSLDGEEASINGATQIRAGVIRPELIVTRAIPTEVHEIGVDAFELKAGAAIRVIREPYFGQLGLVTELPATLQVLESGTEVRVLRAKLNSGEEVTVPRANVEIIAAG